MPGRLHRRRPGVRVHPATVTWPGHTWHPATAGRPDASNPRGAPSKGISSMQVPTEVPGLRSARIDSGRAAQWDMITQDLCPRCGARILHTPHSPPQSSTAVSSRSAPATPLRAELGDAGACVIRVLVPDEQAQGVVAASGTCTVINHQLVACSITQFGHVANGSTSGDGLIAATSMCRASAKATAFRYDPADPAPSLGGPLLSSAASTASRGTEPGHGVRQTRGPLRGGRPHRGHQRVAVSSSHAKPARMARELQELIAARSESLRRTQNSLPSGSARTAQPEPSGFR